MHSVVRTAKNCNIPHLAPVSTVYNVLIHGMHDHFLVMVQAPMYMFRIAINKLFEWLFSGVLASHQGGQGLIPGRDMSSGIY
jgi:hypothetical protein